jgi:hypothetical protein
VPYKILLEDFKAKLGREDIFNLTIGNESQHQDRNDNRVRKVNSATKNVELNSTMFRTEPYIDTPGLLLMGRLTARLITY